MVAERQEYREKSDELQDQVNELQPELQKYAELEGSAFLLFARLSSDINRHGGFFTNLTYRAEEKQGEATRICDVLNMLYGPAGCSSQDPLSVQQDLVRLQRAWMFQATEGHFGQQTLVALINEYLLQARRQT